MRSLRNLFLGTALLAGMSGWAAQGQQLTLEQVIDRVFQRENQEATMLRPYSPTIETYAQDMRREKDLGLVPAADHYFLGKAVLSQGEVTEDWNQRSKKGAKQKEVKLGGMRGVFHKESVLDGFLHMIYVDPLGFDRQHYRLNFVRREFLDEVHCLVFDVMPLEGAERERFLGRIWVEDQDYTIVRLEGTRDSDRSKGFRLHFDSWRVNVAPGVWAPAYIYSAESDVHDLLWNHVRFRAQTRLWGYNAKQATDEDRSPAESQRARGREAEWNAVDRLEASGLLAPAGNVDKILETVVNNLEVSNDLDIQPDVQCHVLLTSTLESFTIGHTIVVSRGLLDVLPDEASLAMILAHELGHVLSGHSLGDEWAFSNWKLFPSQGNFNHFDIPIDPHEEEVANQKAIELLKKSPYNGKLSTAGSFLELLDAQEKTLPNLISSHVESRATLAKELLNGAPSGDANKREQIAALPLGSRIKLDPWTDQVDVLKTKPVALLEGQGQRPFQIGPYMPYLFRLTAAGGTKQNKPTSKKSGDGEQ